MLADHFRAAWVVARRDFTAVIFSKTFIFFLIGPLFPVFIAAMAAALGTQVQHDLDNPQVAVAMQGRQGDALIAARDALAPRMAGGVPEYVIAERLREGENFDARRLLAKEGNRTAAVLSGTLDAPVLTATGERIGQ